MAFPGGCIPLEDCPAAHDIDHGMELSIRVQNLELGPFRDFRRSVTQRGQNWLPGYFLRRSADLTLMHQTHEGYHEEPEPRGQRPPEAAVTGERFHVIVLAHGTSSSLLEQIKLPSQIPLTQTECHETKRETGRKWDRRSLQF